MIVDEINCAGFNTNSILKLFCEIEKSRHNAEDLKHTEAFAQNLQKKWNLNTLILYSLLSWIYELWEVLDKVLVQLFDRTLEK